MLEGHHPVHDVATCPGLEYAPIPSPENATDTPSESRIQILLQFDWMVQFALLQLNVARTWKNAVATQEVLMFGCHRNGHNWGSNDGKMLYKHKLTPKMDNTGMSLVPTQQWYWQMVHFLPVVTVSWQPLHHMHMTSLIPSHDLSHDITQWPHDLLHDCWYHTLTYRYVPEALGGTLPPKQFTWIAKRIWVCLICFFPICAMRLASPVALLLAQQIPTILDE